MSEQGAAFVTDAEMGQPLGGSRERVGQWASNPKYGSRELGGVAGSKIWNWPEVERWAEGRRVEAPAKEG